MTYFSFFRHLVCLCPSTYYPPEMKGAQNGFVLTIAEIIMKYGGVPKYHARSCEDAWHRILRFFSEKLPSGSEHRTSSRL